MTGPPNHVVDSDRHDPLAAKREEFVLPNDTIYLDGNSLGALPRNVVARLDAVASRQWGEDLIQSWNKHDWIDLPKQVGEKIAPILGAASEQVICCDSISVNLFKLLCAALEMNPARSIVLSQTDNFPTDLYIAEGVQNLLGKSRCQLEVLADDQLESRLDEDIAVLLLTQVNFRTGELHDIQALTRAAHEKGIVVIWDLAHSAGVLPLELDAWGVDFAVGCGYKYLNGGPGAPAFVYVAREHQEKLKQPLSGWMGHTQPFDFSPRYQPAHGVERFLSGTPSILALAALDAALDVYQDVDIKQVRAKSIAMADLFIALVKDRLGAGSLTLVSGMPSAQRGSQLSYSHPHAYAMAQALIERGVIVDFRRPDILRFGFTPLYTSFVEVWRATQILFEVVESRLFLDSRFQQQHKVT